MNISLYVPKGKYNMSFVDKELSSAANIKDRVTRQSVEDGLRKIKANYSDGMAFLWINGELYTFKYELKDSVYDCAKDTFLVPNKRDKARYGLVCVDQSECTIGELVGKEIKVLWHETSNVPGKQRNGGQSSHRFQKERAHKITCWYKEIADKMKELWITNELK